MIAIVDYGVGNLFSLRSSLERVGAEVVVTSDKELISAADKIVLPGVGAFEDAAKKLKTTGLDEVVKAQAGSGKPLMGICLGMQLLFERSYEYGCHEGLGLLKGNVVPLQGYVDKRLKIPHIGWNALHITRENPLLKYCKDGDCVYFVHSYAAECDSDSVSAYTDYGGKRTALVNRGTIYGAQFHPEKSGAAGLRMLRNFADMVNKG